jgi:hypothetical protein
MNSREPHSADPTGAPKPLLKQTETLSNRLAIAPAVDPLATAALNKRAPSR